MENVLKFPKAQKFDREFNYEGTYYNIWFNDGLYHLSIHRVVTIPLFSTHKTLNEAHDYAKSRIDKFIQGSIK